MATQTENSHKAENIRTSNIILVITIVTLVIFLVWFMRGPYIEYCYAKLAGAKLAGDRKRVVITQLGLLFAFMVFGLAFGKAILLRIN